MAVVEQGVDTALDVESQLLRRVMYDLVCELVDHVETILENARPYVVAQFHQSQSVGAALVDSDGHLLDGLCRRVEDVEPAFLIADPYVAVGREQHVAQPFGMKRVGCPHGQVAGELHALTRQIADATHHRAHPEAAVAVHIKRIDKVVAQS